MDSLLMPLPRCVLSHSQLGTRNRPGSLPSPQHCPVSSPVHPPSCRVVLCNSSLRNPRLFCSRPHDGRSGGVGEGREGVGQGLDCCLVHSLLLLQQLHDHIPHPLLRLGEDAEGREEVLAVGGQRLQLLLQLRLVFRIARPLPLRYRLIVLSRLDRYFEAAVAVLPSGLLARRHLRRQQLLQHREAIGDGPRAKLLLLHVVLRRVVPLFKVGAGSVDGRRRRVQVLQPVSLVEHSP
mmetsp:Transcript_11716/g.23462  ORF Transcript_11716/g.23462 Transcript_11716/m.23462 type:complete len:236 (-) Transcript_11716:567-1274(-)